MKILIITVLIIILFIVASGLKIGISHLINGESMRAGVNTLYAQTCKENKNTSLCRILDSCEKIGTHFDLVPDTSEELCLLLIAVLVLVILKEIWERNNPENPH
jgi:hypothetical protein